MERLVVVAAHGPHWIGQLRDSLTDRTSGAPVLVVDTGHGDVPGADVTLGGGHPTGAYRWAYEHRYADRYLFLQDSMTALGGVFPWFEAQLPDGGGVVAWARFPMCWDDPIQADRVHTRYPGVSAEYGIFGPVFYVDRASLDALAKHDLMPGPAASKWEAQASERAWAYAFAAAGITVNGPHWSPEQMQVQWGPFRKVWAGRD